jgi:hypothetical protein
MNPKITTDHLNRRAIVYIRQSSPGQVIHNQESQRRQYGLADHARSLGFHSVEVIDEDLGRSGSGQVERPGFQHLVRSMHGAGGRRVEHRGFATGAQRPRLASPDRTLRSGSSSGY